MTSKIFRTSFAVGIGVLILSIGLFLGALYQHFETVLLDQLSSQTALAVQGVEAMGMDYLEGLESEARFTWVDASGTVLFDSAADPTTLDNHADRTEIQQALHNQSGTSIRYSFTLSQRTLYYAQRLEDGSVLRLSSSQDTVAGLLLSMIPSILVILLLAVFLSWLLATNSSKRIIRPILNLDLENPEHTDTYDELTPLLTRIKRQNDTIAAQMDQLRQKQAEFTAITENMSEGFLLLDRQGHILSYNSGAVRLLHGQPPQERAGYLTLNRNPVFCSCVEQALQGRRAQQILNFEHQCCQVLANPVLKEQQVAGAVVVVLDVTEREQREELRREFTANVSHELRTPLTSISGMAEILKNGMVRPEDVPEFASDIYNEAQRLIHLVQDIIRLSQLDENSSAPERQHVELDKLTGIVLHRLKSAAEKAGVTLHLAGEAVCVQGIPHILEEMIYNLCDNAIKYNRPGGSVTAGTQHTARGVEMWVSDTGIGIPQEAHQRVFERFYRVDKSHSRSIGGTGLGLSIVKHGAAFHDAQVELDSQPGVGTTIRLIFPREQ